MRADLVKAGIDYWSWLARPGAQRVKAIFPAARWIVCFESWEGERARRKCERVWGRGRGMVKAIRLGALLVHVCRWDLQFSCIPPRESELGRTKVTSCIFMQETKLILQVTERSLSTWLLFVQF